MASIRKFKNTKSTNTENLRNINPTKIKAHTVPHIHDLSWWIEYLRHHPPPAMASKAVYCREVHKIMATNPPITDKDGSHTERKQKMTQEAGLHIEPLMKCTMAQVLRPSSPDTPVMECGCK